MLVDAEAHALGAHDADIADLAAEFGVEGRLVEDHGAARAGLEPEGLGALMQKRDDRALALLGVVAQKLGRADALLEREPDGLGRRLAGAGPGLARLGALALHGGLEAGLVDGDARAARSASSVRSSGKP